MTDEKRRTLLMWAETEKKLSSPQDHMESLMGWADTQIELQLLREMELSYSHSGC